MVEHKNMIRWVIKNCFPERKCVLFVKPVIEENLV